MLRSQALYNISLYFTLYFTRCADLPPKTEDFAEFPELLFHNKCIAILVAEEERGREEVRAFHHAYVRGSGMNHKGQLTNRRRSGYPVK